MTDAVIGLIDTFGSNLKRWPSSARADYEAAKGDRSVKRAMKRAKRLDARLKKWKDDKEGAEIKADEEDEASGHTDHGDDRSEGGAGGDEPPAPEVSRELMEMLAGAMDEVEDTGDLLMGLISAMVADEFKGQPYIEYTRELDEIELVKPYPDADVAEMEEKVRKVSGVMSKDLQRIITARSLAVMQPGLRKGRINPSALHRMEVNDDRVFRKKVENKSNDVAVSLLVDCSGSMNGKRFELAMDAAWAFADVLDRLNIKCEVLGFTTHGRKEVDVEGFKKFCKMLGRTTYTVRSEPLYMPIAKEFGERFGLESKKRMATMRSWEWQSNNLCQNIDGACVRIAAMRLFAQPAKRKLLMVFSDGSPCSGMDGTVLATDLRKAVRDVEAMGIETIGVGIIHPSVKSFYPKNFSVDTLADLPAKVIGELKTFLTR